MITTKLSGFRELEAQLLELNNVGLAVKALAFAARRAFEPVFIDALRHAPHDTGALVEAIKLVARKPKSGAVVEVGIRIAGPKKFIGPKTRDQATKLPPKSYWHMLEFGTATQAAQPFLRPALDNNAELVLEMLNAELRKSIERALRRKAKGK